ncbi:MAG: hypothetical protein ACREJO_12545 [Phycisphaerales bacterium]
MTTPAPNAPNINPLQTAADLLNTGEIDGAVKLLRRVLARRPMDAGANQLMCVALARTGDLAGAITHARRAVTAAPRDADLLHNLGKLLLDAGAFRRDFLEEAVTHLRAALGIDPSRTRTRVQLAMGLLSLGRFEEVVALTEGAATDPDLILTRADAQAALADMPGAISSARRGLECFPRHAGIGQRVASLTLYLPGCTGPQILAAHQAWGRILESAAPVPLRPRIENFEPHRPVRLLLLSHDLVRHSVAFFVEPILRWLDRSRFHITCVSTRPVEDEVSAHLRTLADDWRHWPQCQPGELASLLAGLRPDMLIQLNGLTEGHSLAALTRRPAPIQGSYIGYPASTGLSCIDFRLADAETEPPTAVEDGVVERIVRLPDCFTCYSPPVSPPPLRIRPADAPPTLGSFNQIFKLADPTIAAWARILNTVPKAVLRLKSRGLERDIVRTDLVRRFIAAGIDPARINMQGWTLDSADHLDQYNDIDVALDTWPYNGTTTTCEALLMGVPVLALAGEAGTLGTSASRVGASLLRAAGFPELIAANEDQFVALAVQLLQEREANHLERPARRALFLNSILCDGPGYGRRLGETLLSMWQKASVRNA